MCHALLKRVAHSLPVSVNINISGRDLRSVTADVQNALCQVTIPNDFRIEIDDLAEDQQESFMYLGIAMLAAILLIYMNWRLRGCEIAGFAKIERG